MKKPNFFIVGAPKCGTTAMSTYLRRHPEVFIPEIKEPHFFGSDLNRRRAFRDEKLYHALFAGADEKMQGEASVWYLYSRQAAKEIKEFNPEARIIIMLRDPVEMLHSLHSQFLYVGNENIQDFEQALEAEEDRKQGLRIPKRAPFVQGLFYRDTARYTEQVERYLETFGPERVHVILFDDFKAHTDIVYEETLRFLEVDTDFRPEFFPVNTNKRVRSNVLRNVLRNPSSRTRSLVKTLVPLNMRVNMREWLGKYNTQSEPRQPIDHALSGSLRSEYEAETKRLGSLIGRDLSHWVSQQPESQSSNGTGRDRTSRGTS